ncbi:PAS domain-containing protein [Pedobacter immunditicola]|uniref:PAS domain-containing protein n=1 Tax=Pedobacter immunditicola TaxID=3133440 RepID=UPI0030A75022
MPGPGLILQPTALNFTILAVNDAYLRLAHQSKKQLIGRPIAAAFSNNPYLLMEDWELSLQKVFAHKEPVIIPMMKCHANLVMTPLLDEEKELIYILCSIANASMVEGQQHVEDKTLEKLFQNEKLFNEMQHLSGVGAWEIDLCNNKVTWSAVQRQIHEVCSDEDIGLTTLISFYKQNKERGMISHWVEEAIHGNNMFDIELNMKTAKGNDRLVRSIGKVEFEDNKCVRLYGITHDITAHKKIALHNSVAGNKFQSLLKTVNAVVWEANAQTFEITYISEHVTSILGYTPEQWKSQPDFWENHIHPDDREFVLNVSRAETKKAKNYTLDYRIVRADGSLIWVKDTAIVITENGKPVALQGMIIDITGIKRLNELEFLEKKTLERNGIKEIATPGLLHTYLEGIEHIYPKMQCAVLQVKNNRLYKWAAPTLPKLYLAAIEGLPVSKSVGCSGAAAFLKHDIIINDIKNDPRWAKHRKVAIKANIMASWSFPIITAENEVLGTFGIYYKEPTAPGKEELKVIEKTMAVLKIILESRRAIEKLQETNILMKQCQEMAHFGIWTWDVVNHKVKWSDSLFNIYGVDKRTYPPTFEAYLDLLHPDDKHRVSVNMGGILSTKKEMQFQERIVRPNGEIRHLKSCAKLILDATGTAVKLIGASMDITESTKMQEVLLADEARLRNLVENQTNYVIRLDFHGRFTYCNDKFSKDFLWIYEEDSLIGLDAIKAIFPHQYQELFNLAENCINHPGNVFEVKIDSLTRDGSLKVDLWQFVCLTDAKGLPFEMQGTGIDFTEHIQAKEALKLEYERYKYVNLAQNEAIYDWDIIDDHISWGDGYCKLFGYEDTIEHTLLSAWLSKVHPDERESIEHMVNENLEDRSKQNWTLNYQFKKLDGSYAHIEENGYILRDDKGKAIRMIGSMRDITTQKKAAAEISALQKELEDHLKILSLSNAELSDSGQNYKDLFYMSPQPMWIFEATTLKFLDVNNAAIRFYGYSRKEFLKMDGGMIIPKEEISKNHDGMNTFMKKEIFFHGVYRHIKKNGEIMHMDVQSKKMNFKGKDTYVVLANDITERIKYLESVEKQNQKLQEISWMQANVVRAPLARLTQLMESIESIANGDEYKVELETLLEHTAKKLEDLLNNIAAKK